MPTWMLHLHLDFCPSHRASQVWAPTETTAWNIHLQCRLISHGCQQFRLMKAFIETPIFRGQTHGPPHIQYHLTKQYMNEDFPWAINNIEYRPISFKPPFSFKRIRLLLHQQIWCDTDYQLVCPNQYKTLSRFSLLPETGISSLYLLPKRSQKNAVSVEDKCLSKSAIAISSERLTKLHVRASSNSSNNITNQILHCACIQFCLGDGRSIHYQANFINNASKGHLHSSSTWEFYIPRTSAMAQLMPWVRFPCTCQTLTHTICTHPTRAEGAASHSFFLSSASDYRPTLRRINKKARSKSWLRTCGRQYRSSAFISPQPKCTIGFIGLLIISTYQYHLQSIHCFFHIFNSSHKDKNCFRTAEAVSFTGPR